MNDEYLLYISKLQYIQDNFRRLDTTNVEHTKYDEFNGFFILCGELVFDVKEVKDDGYTVRGYHQVVVTPEMLKEAREALSGVSDLG